jgi:hypothetical protein
MLKKLFDSYVETRAKYVAKHLLNNYRYLLSDEDAKRISETLK